MNTIFANNLKRDLAAFNITLVQDMTTNSLILTNGSKSIRVRATKTDILFTEIATGTYDYLVCEVKSGKYILLKHDINGVVYDYFKGIEIHDKKGTNNANSTYMSLCNLVGALAIILS